MRRFLSLLNYQIKALIISPSTYVAAFFFTLLMGLIYMLSLNEVSATLGGKSPVELFLSLFWIPVLFIVPLLTMRSIAEERRMGTLQALMTTPVTAFEIVLSKFLASYLFYIFMWTMTLYFPIMTVFTLPQAAAQEGLFSVSRILTGYIFIVVSGATYIAIGLFASSLTRSTLVAGMLSFCILFIVIAGSSLVVKVAIENSSMALFMEQFINYTQSFRHLEDFSNALLDTRPFFLYFSSAAVFIGATTLITEFKAS
ncbi:MAG: ABC transporter permease subunit [Opitutales bacterium]|nr:ABC transporter permease subunit [Opitutales bacterium]